MSFKRRFSPTMLAVGAWVIAALPGCGSGRGSPLAGDDQNPIPRSGDAGSSTMSCATPQEGCACENNGESIDCGSVERKSGNYVSCSLGKRTCTDNHWGACLGDRISAPIDMGSADSKKTANLGSSSGCVNDPCDPYCLYYIDNADGLDAGPPPIAVSDAGLTLYQRDLPVLIACTGMVVVPTPQTITVTGVSPIVTNPASLQFNASLLPSSCAKSYVAATWNLSDYDYAAIDKTGLLTVYAPVAASETVTAYAGSWQATGTATVTVNIADTSQAPAGAAALFAGTAAGNDVATVLYPYDKTVFPRGIKAPVVQWDNGGTPADAVKVSLRYPTSGPTTFAWSAILPEPTAPSATIPQAVWNGLDQTAKGQDATLVLQRVVGGTLRNEITRTMHFTTTPLRGQIYYTEYARTPSSPAPSPDPGGACHMSNSSSVIRQLDPNGTTAPVNPFATVAPGGCPVCHSVSANGKMFVTSNRGWGAGGGVSRINSDSTFTPIADSPQPPVPGADSRGFAFAAITPTGSYALQGSNLWGNTKTAGNTGLSRISGGNGNGLKVDFFNNTSLSGSPVLSRVDQTVSFDWGSGSPDPVVSTDNFSARWYGQVQPFDSLAYTFEVESDDGVRLWVNGNLVIDKWVDQTDTIADSAPINLVGGKKYDIKLEYYDHTGPASVTLRWASSLTLLQVIPETQLYGR
jgi:hypothetical protein